MSRQIEDGRVLADLGANFAGLKIIRDIEDAAVGGRLHLAVGAQRPVLQQLEIGRLVLIPRNVFGAYAARLEDQIAKELLVCGFVVEVPTRHPMLFEQVFVDHPD